jgi:hypothetical protein
VGWALRRLVLLRLARPRVRLRKAHFRQASFDVEGHAQNSQVATLASASKLNGPSPLAATLKIISGLDGSGERPGCRAPMEAQKRKSREEADTGHGTFVTKTDWPCPSCDRHSRPLEAAPVSTLFLRVALRMGDGCASNQDSIRERASRTCSPLSVLVRAMNLRVSAINRRSSPAERPAGRFESAASRSQSVVEHQEMPSVLRASLSSSRRACFSSSARFRFSSSSRQ